MLPCGKVLVAGGFYSEAGLSTAELWDPATGAWSDLPPMTHERYAPGCCVLPSGRVAVVGGFAHLGDYHMHGEVFDLEGQAWQPLPPMSHGRSNHGVVSVACGLLAVGGRPTQEHGRPAELFDEASGRWFELPHPMAQPRPVARVVSLPAAPAANP